MMVHPNTPARGPACHPLCPGAAAGYARLLAAHERGGRPLFTLDGVAFVRQLAEAAGPDDAIPGPFDLPWPRWDAVAGQLTFGALVLKAFKQPAPRQTAVLARFEEQGWVGPIRDPLPTEPGDGPGAAQVRLYETVKNLNRGLPPRTIRFHVEADAVWWERVTVGGGGLVVARREGEFTQSYPLQSAPAAATIPQRSGEQIGKN